MNSKLMLPALCAPSVAILLSRSLPQTARLLLIAISLLVAVLWVIGMTRRVSAGRNKIAVAATVCGMAGILNLSVAYMGCITANNADRGASDRSVRIRQVDAASSSQLADVTSKIPRRDTKATPEMIDLTAYYNSPLHERFRQFYIPSPEQNVVLNLADVPAGILSANGIAFDVRGVIRLYGKNEDLTGRHFPIAVNKIPIDRACSKIFFLHGADWRVPEGTMIAEYVIRFADGQSTHVPVVFGRDVLESWFQMSIGMQKEKISEPPVAWSQVLPTKPRQVSIRFYIKEWLNPTPQRPIQSIDFISSRREAIPFLLGITTESSH